jgi:predicted GH43/DUF377 family glycosyl hydrolase
MGRCRVKYNIMMNPKDIENITSCIPGFEVAAAFNPAAWKINDGYVLFLRVQEVPIIRNEKPKHINPTYCSPRYEFEGGRIKLKENRPSVTVDEFTLRECSLDDPKGGIHLRDGSYRLSTISLIRRAHSHNGRAIDKIDDEPVIPPSSLTTHEEYGQEDPKLVSIDGEYILSTVGPSRYGIVTIFRRTGDLDNFSDPWLVTLPGCKDTFPLPEKIRGEYWRVERPSRDGLTKRESIYVSSSPDLRHWGDFRVLMSCRDDMFDSDGIGPSAPAIRTERGLLLIYHGRKHKFHYSNGAVLMDDNFRVKARSKRPLIELRRSLGSDEFPGITYVSAAILEDGGDKPESKILRVFGGAGDKCPFSAEIPLSNVFDSLEYAEEEALF